ncbi:hypothetical protein STIAU_0025, partial [Stigmatella aurantiaca DW4/3-1]
MRQAHWLAKSFTSMLMRSPVSSRAHAPRRLARSTGRRH